MHRGRIEVGVALGLATGAAVALGFTRFAYALLLPPMRADLGWSYVQAGAINTANGAGYVAGAAAAALLAQRFGMGRAFLASMALSALVLVLSGLTGDFHALLGLRSLAGVANAVTFITGASLASAVAADSTRRSGLMVAIFVCGASGGIIVSGLLLPPLLADGAAGWRAGWLAMGGLSLLALLPAALAVRRAPAAGLRLPGLLPFATARWLAPTFVGYALFGAGYVVYMTFIIVLLRESGAGTLATSGYWILLGASSIAGTLLWVRLLAAVPSGLGPGLVSALCLLGTLPVLVRPGLAAACVSAVVFGGSFMSGPLAITMLVRRLLAPERATAAIAALTCAFALGQAVGPILSGYVTDLTGTIAAGLWVAPLLLAGSGALALLQRNSPP